MYPPLFSNIFVLPPLFEVTAPRGQQPMAWLRARSQPPRGGCPLFTICSLQMPLWILNCVDWILMLMHLNLIWIELNWFQCFPFHRFFGCHSICFNWFVFRSSDPDPHRLEHWHWISPISLKNQFNSSSFSCFQCFFLWTITSFFSAQEIFLGFFGILWDFLGFFGIHWDFWDFFWDSLGFSGILWDPLRFFWDSLRFFEIFFWFFEILWDSLRFFWDSLRFF